MADIGVLLGLNNSPRRIKEIYIGDAQNKPRKVIYGYIGVNNQPRVFWKPQQITTSGIPLFINGEFNSEYLFSHGGFVKKPLRNTGPSNNEYFTMIDFKNEEFNSNNYSIHNKTLLIHNYENSTNYSISNGNLIIPSKFGFFMPFQSNKINTKFNTITTHFASAAMQIFFGISEVSNPNLPNYYMSPGEEISVNAGGKVDLLNMDRDIAFYHYFFVVNLSNSNIIISSIIANETENNS